MSICIYFHSLGFTVLLFLYVQDISAGFVLCDLSSPCSMGQVFDAQIVVLEYKSIICAGYTAVLHIHTVVEEVQIVVRRLVKPAVLEWEGGGLLNSCCVVFHCSLCSGEVR